MDETFCIRAYATLDECAPFASALDALNLRSAHPSPFATFAYLRNHVEHDELRDGGRRPLLLTAWEGDALVGFLPLARVSARMLGLRFPKIELLVTHDADHVGVVAEADRADEVTTAFYRYLDRRERGWHQLELVDQGEYSPLALLPDEVEERCYVRLIDTPPRSFLPIRWRTTTEYYRSLERKFRLSLARSVRRLFASGEVELVLAETPEATRALLDVYTGVERRSWKTGVSGTSERHPERVAFFRGLCDASQAMRLQVTILAVDGLPVAGSVNGIFGDTLYALEMCFDEGVAPLGAGQLIQLMTIRAAIEGGFRTLDLMDGSTHCDERWLAEAVPTKAVQVFRRSSPLYAEAKLGELRRRLDEVLPKETATRLDPEKRPMPPSAWAALLEADAGPTCDAFERVLASGLPLVRYSSDALVSVLPFEVEKKQLSAADAASRRRVVRRAVERPAVAIFDADSPPALAFTRSLGRAGIPVQVYAPYRVSVAGSSRFASGYRVCPDPSDCERFQPWLESEIRAGNITMVAPTSDQLMYYLAELRELFPASVRGALPDRDVLLALLFKDRFDGRCRTHGQPTPWSTCPTSLEEVHAEADHLPYPVILKPRTHVGIGGARGVVVYGPRELRAEYAPYPVTPENRVVLERFPELRWPMVQEYIPAALTSLYSVSGMVGASGEVVALAATRKTAQWPPMLGVGTLFEGCEEDDLLRIGAGTASALVQRGLFELELIHDRRIGRFVAIDLNPRAYGQIALDIARGNDLPLLWYRLATGEPPEPQRAATNHARWVHSIPFHVGNLVGLLRGPDRMQRLDAYLDAFDSDYRRIDIVNDLADPLPSVVFTAKMLRHPAGLIRPFLKSNV